MLTQVTEHIANHPQWAEELALLRSLVLDCNLQEEWKWKQPTYSFDGKNVAIIAGFKHYCSLSFFKGALLSDEHNLLVKPGEYSRHTKMFKFNNAKEIENLNAQIKQYCFEAIEIERAGLKVETKPNDLDYPEELQNAFEHNPSLETAFNGLTPGRQRGYLVFIKGAKQQQTRINRIEKVAPKILGGFGMNDCTCGKSNRMPACDGSHNKP